MTMIQREMSTGLIAALFLAFAAFSANAASNAPKPDDIQKIEREVDQMHATIASNAAKALETKGGSRILFKVDAAALREAMVTDLRDDLRRILREDRIPFAGFAVRDDGVELRIADANNRQRVLGELVSSAEATLPDGVTFEVTDHGDGQIRLAPSESGFAARLHRLVRQSMSMIDQRLRNSGIRQAGLLPDGPDRIRVLLPDVPDPAPVSAMFSKQVHIAFRLVDPSMTAAEALQGNPPAASEILYDFRTREPNLVLKEIAVAGDDIIDAGPGFDAQSREPIASFRFNGRGTRHFAQITTGNIGRPFAIVADDRVISASVIREPILHGSGQIAGNFTLEEANTIAMLLCSGTLPGRLSVVDQQVVAIAGK